ncbi:AAA family ATPase [Patescibacteria group bacterium]|nr:AAA family ATPase [Patescibacteria group bacterium]
MSEAVAKFPSEAHFDFRELLESGERLKSNAGIIIICGEAGTGKTTLSKNLAPFIVRSSDGLIQTGQIVRKTRKEYPNMDPLEIDKIVDVEQGEIIRKANPEDPVILEGRLAGMLASQEKTENPFTPAFSIILTASEKVRFDRMITRYFEENPNELESLSVSQIAKAKQQKRNTIMEEERQRAKDDFKRWTELYPTILTGNPFNPHYKDCRGKRIYDLSVNVNTLQPEETLATVINRMLNLKILARVKEGEEKIAFPLNGIIFKREPNKETTS